MAHAREAVITLGGDTIGPEHLLCGLLNADVLASRHLVALPINATELRERLKGLLGGRRPDESSPDVPLSGPALQVLTSASAEAESLGHRKILSDHFLVAILAGESAVATLLEQNGLDAATVRRDIPTSDPDDRE